MSLNGARQEARHAIQRAAQDGYLEQEASLFCAGVSEEAQVGRRVFASASGCFLYDLDGNRYIDFAAGIFTQSVGHCHPEVVHSLQQQAKRLWNLHDWACPERLDLCRLLADMLPPELDTFCFFSTGAEAVEAAIRLVYSVAEPGRNRLGALRYGFHGKTMGARMLVHWDVGHTTFSGNCVLGYSPYCYRCPFDLSYPSCDLLCAKLVRRHIADKANVAALFFEPVLGAAGVIVPPSGYWEIIQDACVAHGVLLVADEIVTGGGRTGSFLASTQFGLRPDIITMAKGLASGFPFSALIGRKALMNAAAVSGAGFWASTFGNNPLGFAAAVATLEVVRRDGLFERVRQLGHRIRVCLDDLQERHPTIGDVRGIGLLWGIEFVSNRKRKTPAPDFARRIFECALDCGLRIILSGHIIRLAPPFNIPDDAVDEAIAILDQTITSAEEETRMGARND